MKRKSRRAVWQDRLIVCVLTWALVWGLVPVPPRALGAELSDEEELAQDISANAEVFEEGADGEDGALVEDAADPASDADAASGDVAEADQGDAAAVEQGDVSEGAEMLLPGGDAEEDATTASAEESEAESRPRQRYVVGGWVDDGIPAKSVHDANEDLSLTAQANLPSSYRSPYVTPARTQGHLGICWAFATIAASEASLLKRTPEILGLSASELDLSERQLAYFTANPVSDALGNTEGDFAVAWSDAPYEQRFREWSDYEGSNYLQSGGSDTTAMLALASWTGAVLEEDAPFDELNEAIPSERNEDKDINRDGSVDYADQDDDWFEEYNQALYDTRLDASLARDYDVAHLRNARQISMADVSNVKQAIMDYGAASASMSVDEGGNFNESNWSYCNWNYKNFKDSANHVITLVGWDDSYSRNNFGGYYGNDEKPAHNGAWLVKNSWGSGWGNDGLFWLSYDDPCISDEENEATVFEYDPVWSNQNIYQYDGTPAICCITVGSGVSLANVFKASAGTTGELLESVSFVLYDTNVDYQIQVYSDPTDKGNPTSGSKLLSTPAKGRTTYKGYYTVDLPEVLPLVPGSTYAVVVTFSHGDGSDVSYGIDTTDWDDDDANWWTNNAVADGQSFELNAGSKTWNDLALTYDDDRTARIKAFTIDDDLRAYWDMGTATIAAVKDQTYTGKAITPSPRVTVDGRRLVKDRDYKLSYSNNTKVGTATITVTGKGCYTGTKTATFKIKDSTVNVSGLSISGINASYAYTGSAIKPKPTVKYGSTTLKEGTHYVVTYGANKAVGSKKGTVTITGKGIYKGSKTISFDITRAKASSFKVTGVKKSYAYQGGVAIKPNPTIKFGGTKLKKNRDYTIAYKANKKRGTAKIIITGKGNFTGTKTVTFKIAKASFGKIYPTCSYYPNTVFSSKTPKINSIYYKVGKKTIKLKKGRDYTLKVVKRTKKYVRIKITGKGNYTGTATFDLD